MILRYLIFSILLSCSTLPSSRNDILKWTNLPLSKQIKPFISDGCSMWPEGTKAIKNKWLVCCVRHDYAYWIGGSKEKRELADRELRTCVKKSHDALTGNLLYLGTRVGGQAIYETSYKWGYGWRYQRGYILLTKRELDYMKKIGPKANDDLRPFINVKNLDEGLDQVDYFSLK